MRTIKVTISRSNIEDQIAALLYATGKAQDNEDVRNMILTNIDSPDKDGNVVISVDIKKRREVKAIRH